MEAAGHDFHTFPFFDAAAAAILYQPGRLFKKVLGVMRGFWGRLKLTARIRQYDYIFIQREASPIGPPVFEWLWARVLRRKIIYDFDDALWIPSDSAANKIATRLKAFWKIGSICKWAYVIVGGNNYLSDFGKKHARGGRVITIPTVVDTVNRYDRLKAQDAQPLTIGWTGSHSTLPYLDAIVPVISRLQEETDFTFLVIADKRPDLPLKRWEFIPWNRETEISDLLRLNIGVMPLTADPWSEGKCGFKLIQYLSLGIPAVASPVGVNPEIVDHGRNGYIAGNGPDWESYLKQLLGDAGARDAMGRQGRTTIEAYYSLESCRSAFLSLFR